MGRKLEFSKDKALLQAMEGFWLQGYEATSMRDLAHRLSLHLGSVYNALGDKEQVFESALRLHIQHHVTPRLAMLDGENPRTALENYLNAVADDCRAGSTSPGCFIVNSLLHINRINERITAALREYMAMCETALSRCISQAQAQGDITADENPAQLARFVIASCKSMHVMKKIGANDDYIDDIRSHLGRRLFALK